MKTKNLKKRILSAVICVAMCLSMTVSLISCGGGNGNSRPDALVIMTEELDGLFNPFYSTTANDATIIGMTQIAMLTTDYVNKEVIVDYGNDKAVVVEDYQSVYDKDKDQTVYTFVIKNGIKFSDGKPLTMNDVMFNLYVYLDPVYTGSSTMYSTDIVGLEEYRTQKASSSTTDEEDTISKSANSRAQIRINELINLFRSTGKTGTQGSYDADYNKMKAAIQAYSVSKGYKEAVSLDKNSVTNKQLLEDYEYTLKLFKEELARDYEGAVSSYSEEPFKSYADVNFADPVVAFMALEGYVKIEYVEVNGKEDKSKIEKVTLQYNPSVVKDKASAIDYVYNAKISTELDIILSYWGTAATLKTEYAANAKEILLKENMGKDGLQYKNIKGIVSLGHTTDTKSVKIGDKTYTVAHEHNADGTVKNSAERDVLQITINGVDPKAVWNFAFSVAPQHYYAEGYTVDIANNKFGVEYGSFDFMKKVIQSKNRVPMGAGAYKATNASNGDNPSGSDFYSNNIVYFKANSHFLLGAPKIEKIRYQVVSAANALDALQSGAVHFVTPQFTQLNIDRINSLGSSGIKDLSTDQLGYGYIGINAGKVTNINLRKAIMSAMDTSLALQYYSNGTAENIYWPMSTVSWAYPKNENGKFSQDNGKDYPAINFNNEDAIAAIEHYMSEAGVSEGDPSLKITFTIAGANLTEHPTYAVFLKAAELLNSCGWDITVAADVQALTKLSTGSLAVWAAAWGTTVDPDMYQVYHKDSTATSTLAWGYNVVVDNDAFPEENSIINKLSAVIEEARETDVRKERAALYEEAMGYVLDLAIELPVYQRDVLYAYNSNVIKESSLPGELNPYSSPLDRIWEIEFAN
ncbi:MAG: hypothetical protein IJX13_01780 [Clostridia bacterium]|nr:hypothetical protein [Clostridia bacterium]